MLNKKPILIAVTIFVLLIAAASLVMILINSQKENVKIYVAPGNATIKLGDKTVAADKSFHMDPGNYPLIISAPNFKTIKKDIAITNSFNSLVYCLQPDNMTLSEYMNQHPEDRYVCEGAIGQEYNQDAQAAIDKYPVIAHLPYEDGTFKIGQGVAPNGETALYVHFSTDKSKGEALDWIKRYLKDATPPIFYQGDYEQTDRIGGKDSEIDKALVAKYAIVTSLPIDAGYYKLGYRIDESDPSGQSIKLTINADTAIGRLGALRQIGELGFKPTDYKVEFINFESDLQ